ncbi:MAG: YdbH domain-containing protein, partial [Pseudomonadota bacterium]
VIGGWLSRERIAGNLIDDQLAESGLEATYDIVSIGPQQQVIENLVIGDAAAPDLTAERVVASVEYGFLRAGLGQIEVTGARLYGSYRDGELSFGALDPLLFAETEEPPRLPELDVKLVDARGLIDTDYGAVGLKLDGEGLLSDGFAGKLAATAPGLGSEGCAAGTATLYGDLTTPGGVPRFSGPVRLRDAACSGVALASADIAADLALDTSFTAVDGNFDITASGLTGFDASSESIGGTADLTWRDGELTFQHDLTVQGLASPYGSLAQMTVNGLLRSAGEPLRSDWSARFDGEGASLPLSDNSALSDARAATEGTFAASLLAKLQSNLARSANNGRIAADLTLRQSEDGTTLIVPEARLRASSGHTLVAVSRLSWTTGGRLSANLVTGGEGLPRITGRMEQVGGGALALRLEMDEYRAGDDHLAVPQLLVRSEAEGDIAFDGFVTAGGAIPDGMIEGLQVPLKGKVSPNGEVAVGQECTAVRFGRAAYFDLTVDGQTLTLCPQDGQPIIAYREKLQIGARSGALQIEGDISGSPLTITAANGRLGYPGDFALENLSAVIGEDDNAARLTAAAFQGVFDDIIGGTFAYGTAQLDVVPLDLDQLGGNWRYEDGIFLLDQGAFRLTERTEAGALPRFEALFARDATLALDGNAITANARMREPDADRLIVEAAIQHDLGSGAGQAALDVPGIVFDDALQPDQLSYLASGVIAEAAGTITGDGLIRWTADDLTSTGAFTTENFDFAAAFGPVTSVRGTMRFADLLAITTEPGQVLEVGSVNPGIEVLSGRVVYDLKDGQVLNVEDARWPFMGGELILRPVTLDYGETGGARYVFEIVGLDAATFVSQMELTNLGATGTFDGTVPVVFDTIGNGRIEGGLLISRQPGGNVAYIGDLTYEDLGAMGNYAFQALRSLDYSQMSIGLNGDLAGEIITNFQFDGVSQGEGTTQNFVTRRLASLPIRFKVNVRSENFYELSTVVRSFFDPEYLGNPIDRGLFNNEAGRFVPINPAPEPPPPGREPQDEAGEATRPDESPVQPPESEEMQ